MARKLGYTDRHEFSRLTGAATSVSVSQVRDLEHRLMEFAYAERDLGSQAVRGLGWLTAFARDMLPEDGDNLQSTMLARWLSDLSNSGPTNSAEALVMGEALLGLLGAAPSPAAVELIWSRHRAEITRTVRSLVAVATRPPGGGALAAVHTAARVGPSVLDVVEEHLRGSPVGFRAMRIVTRMTQLLSTRSPSWWSADGRTELETLQRFLGGLDSGPPLPDPYPARSLFLEAVRAVTQLSIACGDQWGVEVGPRLLHDHLVDRSRPRRERIYAAYCILELGLQNGEALSALWGDDGDRACGYIRELHEHATTSGSSVVEALIKPTDQPGEPFELGLLRHAGSTAGLSTGAPYLARLPESITVATVQLLACALLNPDGPGRSQACDALREAGVTNESNGIIGHLVTQPDCPDWLVEMGAFTIGQLGDPVGAETLEQFAGDTRRSVPIRHAAFFALGDLRQHRPRVVHLAAEALTTAAAETPVEVRRAAAYAIAVLRPDAAPGSPTLPYDSHHQALLEYIANPHAVASDWIIRMLAQWGLDTHLRAIERDRGVDERSIWGVQSIDISAISPETAPPSAGSRRSRRGQRRVRRASGG
jgi:hypothetical protein